MIGLAYISGENQTDADMIRHIEPIRLVQPEWVSDDPWRFTNWQIAETEARLVLILGLWFASVAFVSRRFFKSRAIIPWLVCYVIAAIAVVLSMEYYLEPLRKR